MVDRHQRHTDRWQLPVPMFAPAADISSGAENSIVIKWNETADQLLAAVIALSDYVDWDTMGISATGGPLPTTPIVLSVPFIADLELFQNNLQGGSDPQMTITPE